jgi:hypothetical protein
MLNTGHLSDSLPLADGLNESVIAQPKEQGLTELWLNQISKQQVESDRVQAKRHSLELTLGRKIFGLKRDDRSIVGSHKSQDNLVA